MDDEAIIRMELAMDLGELGFDVHEAHDVTGALAAIEAHPGIVGGVFDVHLNGDLTGYDLVRIVREKQPFFAVIMITGSGFLPPPGFDEQVLLSPKPVDSRRIALTMSAKLGLPDVA
ncbi:response regulator [Enterovirga rhinocerotis]|uniref:response regulator n=1 Tax=Enterovirga rhinocerotis TaxID=1339210 RepID=UPI001414FA17|nr:response regulator [Enterovirga rhinocerotis]